MSFIHCLSRIENSDTEFVTDLDFVHCGRDHCLEVLEYGAFPSVSDLTLRSLGFSSDKRTGLQHQIDYTKLKHLAVDFGYVSFNENASCSPIIRGAAQGSEVQSERRSLSLLSI